MTVLDFSADWGHSLLELLLLLALINELVLNRGAEAVDDGELVCAGLVAFLAVSSDLRLVILVIVFVLSTAFFLALLDFSPPLPHGAPVFHLGGRLKLQLH